MEAQQGLRGEGGQLNLASRVHARRQGMHCTVPTCMLQPFQSPALQRLPAAYLHLAQSAARHGGLHKRFKGRRKGSLEARGQQQVGSTLRHGGRLDGGQARSAAHDRCKCISGCLCSIPWPGAQLSKLCNRVSSATPCPPGALRTHTARPSSPVNRTPTCCRRRPVPGTMAADSARFSPSGAPAPPTAVMAPSPPCCRRRPVPGRLSAMGASSRAARLSCCRRRPVPPSPRRISAVGAPSTATAVGAMLACEGRLHDTSLHAARGSLRCATCHGKLLPCA